MRADDAVPAGRRHTLTLEGRQRATITGVEEVASFNEQAVTLTTTEGTLTLLGDEMHISRLNLEEGQLLVEGRVAALEYDERTAKPRGGVRRLFS